MSEAKNEFGSSDQLGLVDKMRRWLDGDDSQLGNADSGGNSGD